MVALQATIKDFFFFSTISSLQRELLPTRTLKWPGQNRVQNVQQVCFMLWRVSSAIKFDRAEIAFLFFFCVPQPDLWGSLFWVRFSCTWPCLNPAIEVVTFRPCRCCLLGVFLLLAFTRLRHECQDLLSLCDGVHVCTDKTSVYTLTQKSLAEWSQNPC